MEKFQYLIAPVTLDALCIGSTTSDDILAKSFTPSHGEFQGLAGFSETNRPFLSDAYVRRPFSYESPYYLGAGVHLHWDLPRALKTGVQAAGPENAEDESCDLEYPPVPNRWLVTRIWTAAAKSDTPKTRICHWIVESDYLASAKEEPATDLPWFKDDDGKGDLFRYMGRAIKLADSPSWAEDPAASRFDPLTALGYGEPAFTAYYPDCRTVFGFHDRNLEAEGFNHEQDTLSYAVMGWYSDKGADPVALAVQDDRLPDLLTQFHWYLPEGDPGGAAGLICRGFTYDVDWHKDATLLPNQFDPNDVTVAVGNTASEGLATLLKNRKSPGTDGGEKLLHALQDGHMEALDRLDALAELEKLLHKDTFGTQSGGLLWKIQAVQSGAGTVTRQKVPAEFIESLNQLNSEQAKLNRTQENIETVRRSSMRTGANSCCVSMTGTGTASRSNCPNGALTPTESLNSYPPPLRTIQKAAAPPTPIRSPPWKPRLQLWNQLSGSGPETTDFSRICPKNSALSKARKPLTIFPTSRYSRFRARP